jgi:hypothetical protein
MYLILSAALGPGVRPASNRNEYQKIFLGGERCRRVRPTTLPPRVSGLSRQYGTLNISPPCRLRRPVTGIALFYF